MATPVQPKQARARATRTKLLSAAVAELVEHGYFNLTTTGVAQRAGVSRGAQQNYFPHKRTLVIDAVRQLAARQIEELNERVADAPRGRDRLRVALDILFEQYSGPLFTATVELSLAARDEPGLAPVIGRGERAVAQAIRNVADSIFDPEITKSEAFTARWATVLAAVRGLALLKLLGYSAASVDRQWASTRADLESSLADWV